MNDSTTNLLGENPDKIAHLLMQRAQNPDGLPEIAAGLILLTLAGLNGLQAGSPPGSAVYKDSGIALLALMMLLVIPFCGSKVLIKRIRARFLLGRIGYVKAKPLNRKQYYRLIGICLLALIVAGALAYWILAGRGFPPLSWLLAVNGISFGFLAILAYPKPRYYFGGGLLAATGIVLALKAFPQSAGMAILYGFIGLFCLVSGSITLLILLRAPAEPGE